MGSTLNVIQKRQQSSTYRWRLREAEREKLKQAGLSVQESNNVGVVYLQTSAGRISYLLVSGRWKLGNPAAKLGVGVQSLLRFIKSLED